MRKYPKSQLNTKVTELARFARSLIRTSFSARASNFGKVGTVKGQPFLKQQPLETDTKIYFQGKRVLPVS